jgi:transcription initiation factor TFIID subunit 6
LEAVPFRCLTSSGGNGSGRCIYFSEEKMLNLNEIISSNNQNIKIPNDFVINAHWLAIEGIQPAVPENPQFINQPKDNNTTTTGEPMNKNASKQQQLQQQKVDDVVKLKTLLPHDLSLEQQIYFKEITEACVGSNEQKRTEALNSLSIDPGLHQLLPRFVLFISEGVRLNIAHHNMAILIYLMRMAKSLVENKSIFLEKYLHELLPSILSCVLNRKVCTREEENHWALREFGARVIGQIVK